MQTKRSLTKAILKTIAQGDNRSPLFWWMVQNHDQIASTAGKRIHWKGVCATAAERGLTDTRGQPPSERNARETWRQARKAVAEVHDREAGNPRKPSLPPSKLPRDWRPTTAVVPAAKPGNAKAWNPEEQLARLRRTLDGRSGRLEERE